MRTLVTGAAGFIGSQLVDRLVTDVSKACRFLGYDPSVFIEEGIGRLVAWLREHEGRLM